MRAAAPSWRSPTSRTACAPNEVLREHDAALATQQASLQRIATLVAEGAASEDVFAGIAREVAQLLGLPIVLISRYEPDGTMSVLANWSDRPHRFQTGSRWPLDGPSVSALVQQTGRPVRIDDYENVRSTIGDAVRESGMSVGRRRSDRRRRPRLGQHYDRPDRSSRPARPHRRSTRRVHGSGRRGRLERHEPRRARIGRERASRVAARCDARRPRRRRRTTSLRPLPRRSGGSCFDRQHEHSSLRVRRNCNRGRILA